MIFTIPQIWLIYFPQSFNVFDRFIAKFFHEGVQPKMFDLFVASKIQQFS